MIPYFVRVKFGLWDEVLELSLWENGTAYQEAIKHYARGMAFLGKDDLVAAEAELKALKRLVANNSLGGATIWGINSLQSIMEIASSILEGELMASELNFEAAIEKLTEAVSLEGQLLYNEPPDWFLSTRHHLGAVLLEAEKYEEAETVFSRDLEVFPKNGWAYRGLMLALEKSGKSKASVQAKAQFDAIWNTADVTLHSSRIK